MRYDCKFNPDKDIMDVVPNLETDLKVAMETGIVADTGQTVEFNDIEEPGSILGRVNDVFDAIEAQRSILAKGRITPQQNTTSSANTTTAQPVSTPPVG